jgi:uridine kinase
MHRRPKLIAIAGGSGAGKSWLADRLQRAFGESAARLSLDNFYLDRSHLPLVRRARINFDHPRAIDWPKVEAVLRDCRTGQAMRIPQYDFATHTRRPHDKLWAPGPLVLVDGLWLLSQPRVRTLFDLCIYLDCPAQLRLERRLSRDVAERGRTADAVREQFWTSVAPMHDRHVVSQFRQAHLVLQQPPSEAEIRDLIATLSTLAPDAVPIAQDARSAVPPPGAEPGDEPVRRRTHLASVHHLGTPPTGLAGTDHPAPLRTRSPGPRSGGGGTMEAFFPGGMDFGPTGYGCSTASFYE